MVLKVDMQANFNDRFTFRDGLSAVASMKVDTLTADADATFQVRTFSLFRNGFVRNDFRCQCEDSLVCRARKVGWVRPSFDIDSYGHRYQLRPVTPLKIGVFDGKACIGQIRRDTLYDYPDCVTGFEGLPEALWLFSFWISLKYWSPRNAAV